MIPAWGEITSLLDGLVGGLLPTPEQELCWMGVWTIVYKNDFVLVRWQLSSRLRLEYFDFFLCLLFFFSLSLSPFVKVVVSGWCTAYRFCTGRMHSVLTYSFNIQIRHFVLGSHVSRGNNGGKRAVLGWHAHERQYPKTNISRKLQS